MGWGGRGWTGRRDAEGGGRTRVGNAAASDWRGSRGVRVIRIRINPTGAKGSTQSFCTTVYRPGGQCCSCTARARCTAAAARADGRRVGCGDWPTLRGLLRRRAPDAQVRVRWATARGCEGRAGLAAMADRCGARAARRCKLQRQGGDGAMHRRACRLDCWPHAHSVGTASFRPLLLCSTSSLLRPGVG